MDSKGRLFSRLEGRAVSRAPNLYILMRFAAWEIGMPYKEFCLDDRQLEKGNIVCARKYGIDCVTTMRWRSFTRKMMCLMTFR